MTPPDRIRCGDVVLHRPTGERWRVAYADYETGEMSWTGWPEGIARIDDCERVSAGRASDKQHREAVAEWMAAGERGSQDHRVAAVRRLYAEAATLLITRDRSEP